MKMYARLMTCAFMAVSANNGLQAADKTPAPPSKVRTDEPVDEVARIDLLIKATKQSLDSLETLRSLLVDYKKAEIEALKNPDNTDNLVNLVQLAKQIQDIITKTSLQDYFSPQFLEELKKFSQIAEKKNVPLPK